MAIVVLFVVLALFGNGHTFDVRRGAEYDVGEFHVELSNEGDAPVIEFEYQF